MAATIVRCKGVINTPNSRLFLTSLWTKEYHLSNRCELHTSQSIQVDRRKDRAIVQHLHFRDYEKTMKHRTNPILELPDYSYTDGRPTEVAICQKQRQQKNYEMAKQIVTLVGEMNFAKEQLLSQTNAQSTKQKERLDSRLKEKNIQI